VNETPKFQCLEATNSWHTNSVRVDNVDDLLIITLDLNSAVSCFPTFKLTQNEFYICDRYELTYMKALNMIPLSNHVTSKMME
jgi:hypothetical protein